MSRDWPVILATLGAAGMARAAMGLESYPFGDDLVYGPLARAMLDPTLYAGDAQLEAFGNHAWLYSWLWIAADRTLGVAPVFLAMTLAISAAVALGLLSIMNALGARGRLAPLALCLAVAVEQRGVGRGDYGGAFTDHFHLQGVAIALSLFAVSAVFRGRALPAGALLGVAALAHPVLALHAAAAIGLAWIFGGRRDFRALVYTAGLAALIAAPFHMPLLATIGAEPLTRSAEDVIRNGYYFRASHHYLIPAGALLVLGLYLVAGLLGALTLSGEVGRRALGLIVGFASLTFLLAIFHWDGIDPSFRYVSTLIYVLDFSRSTPLIWCLGPALALAALEASGDLARPRRWALAAPLVAIAAINIKISVFAWGAYVLAVLFAFGSSLATGMVLAGAGALLTTLLVLKLEIPRRPPVEGRPLIDWLRFETRPGETIIAPPGIANLREFARRPVYVDFRMVSMAQPAQIMLFRERMERITPGFERAGAAGGWDAAVPWSILYFEGNDPLRIAELLRDTGATYFVGLAASGFADEEVDAAGLLRAYSGERFQVYARRP